MCSQESRIEYAHEFLFACCPCSTPPVFLSGASPTRSQKDVPPTALADSVPRLRCGSARCRRQHTDRRECPCGEPLATDPRHSARIGSQEPETVGHLMYIYSLCKVLRWRAAGSYILVRFTLHKT